MAAYRFRVTFEDDTDLYRDIEIRADQTFFDFHSALSKSFEFAHQEMASFYMSDDNWRKGEEIMLEDMSEDGDSKKVKLMHKSVIADFIEDPHQKLIYVYDFFNMWTFTIELMKIIPKPDAKTTYPNIVKATGDIPKQFKGPQAIPLLSDEDEEDESMNSSRKKNTAYDDEDEYGLDEDEMGDDIQDGFDEFSSGSDHGKEDY